MRSISSHPQAPQTLTNYFNPPGSKYFTYTHNFASHKFLYPTPTSIYSSFLCFISLLSKRGLLWIHEQKIMSVPVTTTATFFQFFYFLLFYILCFFEEVKTKGSCFIAASTSCIYVRLKGNHYRIIFLLSLIIHPHCLLPFIL